MEDKQSTAIPESNEKRETIVRYTDGECRVTTEEETEIQGRPETSGGWRRSVYTKQDPLGKKFSDEKG